INEKQITFAFHSFPPLLFTSTSFLHSSLCCAQGSVANKILLIALHMITLLSVLFLCLPGAERKRRSATSAPCSTDSPVKNHYPVVRRTGTTQLEQQSSSEANARTAVVASTTTPSSGAAENPMSPSADTKVLLRVGPSSASSSGTAATMASRPGRTQLDDESNAAAVSHTGARAEKKSDPTLMKYGAEQSSRSDKSEPKNGESGGRQLSWPEPVSGGQSQDYLRRHYDKHGVEIPRNGPLTRLDVLLVERAAKEKEAEAQIEEERLKMEDRKKSESGKKKKKKRKDKKKDKSSSRRKKDKRKKKKEKKEGTKSGGSSGGTTVQPTGETEKEEGLYTAKTKKKGGKTKEVTVTDNAIADPTEQAPAADAVSETGRKATKTAPQPKAKRPNWTDCVPESKLPDEWTENDNSKNNKTRQRTPRRPERRFRTPRNERGLAQLRFDKHKLRATYKKMNKR
uniref:Uncharacterized protein n=1 Tax=Pristionchus pacificus TaxID=54126 RepID=A0A8R1YQW9_PRIPA